jgi:hypothetical protein
MDDRRFNGLARALGAMGGRRDLLRAMVGAAWLGLAVPGDDSDGATARNKHYRGRRSDRDAAPFAAEKKRKKKKKRCKPTCQGKVCGSNGCPGGTCGTCSATTHCTAAGQCVGCLSRGDYAPLACNTVTCDQTGTCVYTPIGNGAICGTKNDICCGGQCVDTANDEANCGTVCSGGEACRNGLCCTVCAGGDCPHSTVQAAIDAAAAGATIHICPGTYVVRSTIAKNLTLVGMGASADDTVLRDAQAAIVRVNSGATVTVRNLTVTGATSCEEGAVSNGGTLTLEAVQIVDNTTTFGTTTGGGITNGGTITLVDCLVSGNAGPQGGAMRNTGPQGGAMRNTGQATLVRTTMQFNIALSGGGVSNESSGTVLRLTQASRIRLNQATAVAGSGGGVFNGAGTVMVDASSKILGNTPHNCVNAVGGTGCPP